MIDTFHSVWGFLSLAAATYVGWLLGWGFPLFRQARQGSTMTEAQRQQHALFIRRFLWATVALLLAMCNYLLLDVVLKIEERPTSAATGKHLPPQLPEVLRDGRPTERPSQRGVF